MTTATVAEVRSHFDAFLKASEAGPIILTRKGKPVAVLMSSKNSDEVNRLMEPHVPRLRTILDKANTQIEMGQGIPEEKFWTELDATYSKAARRTKSTVRNLRRKKAV